MSMSHLSRCPAPGHRGPRPEHARPGSERRSATRSPPRRGRSRGGCRTCSRRSGTRRWSRGRGKKRTSPSTGSKTTRSIVQPMSSTAAPASSGNSRETKLPTGRIQQDVPPLRGPQAEADGVRVVEVRRVAEDVQRARDVVRVEGLDASRQRAEAHEAGVVVVLDPHEFRAVITAAGQHRHAVQFREPRRPASEDVDAGVAAEIDGVRADTDRAAEPPPPGTAKEPAVFGRTPAPSPPERSIVPSSSKVRPIVNSTAPPPPPPWAPLWSA